MQNDKNMLRMRYGAIIDTLKKQQVLSKTENTALSERLKKSVTLLQEALRRNADAVGAASQSITRISERIARGMREIVQNDQQLYSQNGKTATNPKTAVSIKIDEVL
jgi:hypothetical protein